MHSDAQALAAILNDSLASANAWIDSAIDEQEDEGFSIWPVVRKDSGALIGRCGLHRIDEGEVEVAWAFAHDAPDGLAAEAARAAIDFGKNVLHLRTICALIAPLDSASVAVAHELDLHFDRVVRASKRDALRYATG